MADSDVPSLPQITNINAGTVFYVVEGGVDYHATAAQLAGGLFSARIEVSSAQILALNSSPIELVAAPGAGKMIRFDSATTFYAYGTSPYATVDSINFAYAGGGNAGALEDLTQGQSTTLFSHAFDGGVDSSNVENMALVLFAQDGDPTGGDGTLVIDLLYRIVDLP